MTPLLHIGHYKTGTTWLQEQVFGRRDRGFWPIAPDDLPPVESAKFAGYPAVVCRQRELLSPHDHDYRLDWRALIEGRPQDAVPVVSNERLCGYFMGSGLDSYAIARRLKRGFPEARILITIREQRDMILSSYTQYLKRGGVIPLNSLVGRKHDQRLAFFSSVYFEYHNVVETYQDMFGAENVLVLPYEMFRARPQTYLDRIYEFAGACGPADWIPDFSRKSNETAGTAGLAARRRLSRLLHSTSLNNFSGIGRISKKIGLASGIETMLQAVPGAFDQRMTKTFKRQIAKAHPDGRFFDSNRRLEQAVGLQLASYGYD